MEATTAPQPVEQWNEMTQFSPEPKGYVSIYLSDDLARLPVRAVTLPGNNKSDPNLETLSFGVFSTCEPALRYSTVRRGIQYLFFATNHHGKGRALTGYYRLRWWAEGSFGAARRDYAVAADLGRFTAPVAFADIPDPAGEILRKPFRQMKLLLAADTDQLLALLDSLPDRTADYIDEIQRLERYNAHHAGVAYSGWAEGGIFDWASAARYLKGGTTATSVPNSSPSDWWRCEDCGGESRNRALLKRCPACGAVGTLRPVVATAGS